MRAAIILAYVELTKYNLLRHKNDSSNFHTLTWVKQTIILLRRLNVQNYDSTGFLEYSF